MTSYRQFSFSHLNFYNNNHTRKVPRENLIFYDLSRAFSRIFVNVLLFLKRWVNNLLLILEIATNVL